MSARVNRLAWPALFTVLVVALIIGSFSNSPHSARSPQQRIDQLSGQIRCPTCQGLSVQQSESPLAQSAKEEITSEVQAGRSDSEIRSYFVSRYGRTALMSPERHGFTLTAWLVPALVALALIVGVVFAVRRWHETDSRSTPTEDERRLVEAALEGAGRS